jgi:tRNA guanosine-2'-O-methyltransferase
MSSNCSQCLPVHFVLQVLLSWLLDQKAKGYFIFGLEQTASSVSLDSMVFPDRPSILLLGKEKEGIPVELLQAVDQCVEIPQLGIIRSLNVHVSGAIAIWEHTKQRRLRKALK